MQEKEINGTTRESEKIELIRENPEGYFQNYRARRFGFVQEKPTKKS